MQDICGFDGWTVFYFFDILKTKQSINLYIETKKPTTTDESLIRMIVLVASLLLS